MPFEKRNSSSQPFQSALPPTNEPMITERPDAHAAGCSDSVVPTVAFCTPLMKSFTFSPAFTIATWYHVFAAMLPIGVLACIVVVGLDALAKFMPSAFDAMVLRVCPA